MLVGLIIGAGKTEKEKRKREGLASLLFGFALFVGLVVGGLLFQVVVNDIVLGIVEMATDYPLLIFINGLLLVIEFAYYYRYID